jgi:DNA-binding transcriptional ArsR family regulator
MRKGELESYLAEGLSLEQIGKRVGRNPSTISYHLKKHGLKPVNQGKHANKGRISEDELRPLVDGGATLREMAAELGRSVATIRHWLKKYGLVSDGGRRRALANEARSTGQNYATLECHYHGVTRFILEGRGYFRCLQCRKERVAEWRRRVKRRLVEEAGGSCVICGYDRCVAALHFHHLDPTAKSFALSQRRGDSFLCLGPRGSEQVRPLVLELPRRSRIRSL